MADDMVEKFKESLPISIENAMESVIPRRAKKYNPGAHLLPRKTGNLSRNSFKVKQVGDNKWDVYIDGTTAPYARYLDEPGKVTKNFWDRSAKGVMLSLAHTYNGRLQKTTVANTPKKKESVARKVLSGFKQVLNALKV